MIAPIVTTVSCTEAVAANDVVSFSFHVRWWRACFQNYVVAIYDRVYHGHVCNTCGRQHRFDLVSIGHAFTFRVSSSSYMIALIGTAASSTAVVANNNHSSDCMCAGHTRASEASGRFRYQSSYCL